MKKEQLQKHLKKSGGKLSLKQNIPNVLFVPSLTPVLQHLGFNPSFENIAKFVQQKYNTTLKLSPSSQRNLDHDGIGVNSLINIKDWLKSLPKKALVAPIIRMAFSFTRLRAQVSGSTSSEWLPFLHGLKLGNNGKGLTIKRNGHTFNAENSLFLKFIEERCKIQDQHLKAARIDIKHKKFNPHCPIEVWRRISELWSQHSLIPTEQLDKISKYAEDLAQRTDEPSIHIRKPEQAFLYLEYDFFLEAIALLETDLFLLQKNHADIDTYNPWQGLLRRSIETYASSQHKQEDNSVKNCLGGLLSNLIEMQNDKDGSTEAGWHWLSTHIPLSDSDSSASLSERQYNAIKGWRNGTDKDRPSYKTFKVFASNFLNHVDGKPDQGDVLLPYFFILVMLDRMESSILKRTAEEDKIETKAKIQEVLARYPIYYQECLQRYEFK